MTREENNKKKRQKEIQKKSKKFHRLFFINVLFGLLFFLLLFFLNIVPNKYLCLIAVVFFFFFLLLYYLLWFNHWQKRLLGIVLSFVFLFGSSYGIYSLIHTYGFFQFLSNSSYKIENYALVVLKDSDLKSWKDLKNHTLGDCIKDEKSYQQLQKKVFKKYSIEEQRLEDFVALFENLEAKKIDAILLMEEELELYLEGEENLKNSLETIDTIEIRIPIEESKKEVNPTTTPFALFLAGNDAYGNIAKSSRNDVNMVIIVHPEKHQVFLLTIPRDYYVEIANKNGKKDKITHAGIYGIDTSVQTVENFLEIPIHYYIKVNFTSLISLVDTLGGVTIENPISFKAYYYDEHKKNPGYVSYSFKKGSIHLTGEEALAYSRERYTFVNGDITRGENQQRVLKAILKEALEGKILTKYNSIIKDLEGSFSTNMNQSAITNLIKKQLEENASWQIDSMVLEGDNAFDYTLTYPKSKSYVMKPDVEKVNLAKEKVKEYLEK